VFGGLKSERLQSWKARLGDLWWYSILMFAAQRLCDAVNMIVGLWIVPRYVPMNDLGAVLPLMSMAGFVALPFSVVTIPFMKFVSVFMERGQYGKAKALIRDAVVGSVIFSVVVLIVSWAVLPHFFARARLGVGSLGWLIFAGAVLGAVSSMFGNAVSALKQFSAQIWFSVIAAPMRIALMLIFMPFRALSGYMVGQNANALVTVGGSFLVLRRWWRSTPGIEPYWHENKRAILRYLVPILALTAASNISGTLDSLVVRYRLSDFDSAGYYMITRFSDVALYTGSAFSVFIFPMLAGNDGESADVRRLMRNVLAGNLVSGLVVGAFLFYAGGWILSLRADWSAYAVFSPQMTVLAVTSTFTMIASSVVSVFTARNRFGFLRWYLPVIVGKSAFLYVATGMEYLSEVLPDRVFELIASFNPCRLSVVVWYLCAVQLVVSLMLVVCAIRRRMLYSVF
jgi:O-antigen/teichoic acid export membrane protein